MHIIDTKPKLLNALVALSLLSGVGLAVADDPKNDDKAVGAAIIVNTSKKRKALSMSFAAYRCRSI